jgi:acetyl esterase
MTAAFLARGGTLPDVAATEEHRVGAVPVWVYRPSLRPGLPVVLRIHGGGWTLGSTDWLPFEALSRGLAADTNCVVVDVDYRLAPEQPYPAAVQDRYATT